MSEENELIEEYIRTMHELEESLSDKIIEIKEKDHQIAVLKKALELAVTDKCKYENALVSTSLGFINGKVAVHKKEQWYLEKAKEMMKSE